MHQILQNLGTGETVLMDVPTPQVSPGRLLLRTSRSLVSIGTERMLVEFGRAGWIQKARQQPDKVLQVLQKIRTDGLVPTLDAVRSKLDEPLPLGYCNAGVVVETGAGVAADRFAPGTRVVSNGPHAEFVLVPENLCAAIPEGVSDEAAAFAVVGSIGLQGIRLIQPTLGESVVVTGLGLIGLLCVQMLRANGCRVLGIDLDPAKCALARRFGAEVVDLAAGQDPVAVAQAWTGGRGVDGVLITASTRSSEPVRQAAHMCRKRGRIVLVGVTGLELSRADFYQKELTFQVSCSYGPGRYEAAYEQRGLDYPVGFVRWTEQRNFEAFLELLRAGSVDVAPLVSHRFPFAEALRAYELVAAKQGLGIILEYGGAAVAPTEAFPASARVVVLPKPAAPAVPEVVVGVLGAGNFTGRTLLPALAKTGARLRSIASGGGVTASHLGRKFGFEQATTDSAALLADDAVNLLMVTTRHNSHARYVVAGLQAGRRVFVEKPLCLTFCELEEIRTVHAAASAPFLMVGFNRRFAPHVVRMRQLLGAVPGPKSFVMTVNAGAIPADHWTQDPAVGGGRIVGEACHFIDLLRFLAGGPVVRATATYASGPGAEQRDIASLQLAFADGSIGTVHYLASGGKSFPKERLEVFCQGRVLQLDNFRVLHGFDWPGFSRQKLWSQDKGHEAEMRAVVDAVRQGGPSPIPFEELCEVASISLRLAAGESYERPRM